jgi:hypothetical protein
MRMPLASLLALVAGCSVPAHADRVAGPPAPGPGSRIAIGIAPAKVRAPYDVQVIRENGETLPTYAAKDRYYVQGNAGERYVIRVTNPTPNRVEAVVTVDGLDVIDGENGDLRKRGYVVPAYGDVRIEGFRTSHADVATFRFSSVNDSYAGQKGKARNVGVIAVAIFEEHGVEPEQQIIVGDAKPGYREPYDYTDDLDEGITATGGRDRGESKDIVARKSKRSDSATEGRVRPAKKVAEAEKREMPSADAAPPRTSIRRPAPPPPAPTGGGASAPRPMDYDGDFEGGYEEVAPPPVAQRNNRPGLGTEFGESRYSAASFTRFQRAAGAPIAIAELRYNNAAGLIALGIHAEPLPDAGEIMTRETADPFPGDDRFARPPGR